MESEHPGMPIELFDPGRPVDIRWRNLPHWGQDGTLCFITFRTNDSIPVPVLQQWARDRDLFLRSHRIDPRSPTWKQELAGLGPDLLRRFNREFSDRWHDMLDDCHGERLLARREYAQVVADSLRHFDGQRYVLTDFAIMPTHVHVLASFPDGKQMLAQCDSWKHFTAATMNRMLGRKGRFWDQDGFDHLVRTGEQFAYLRRYIADNPKKARLRDGEWLHYCREM